MEKTNVMRILDRNRIAYRAHFYDQALSGTEVARALGEAPERVFKTVLFNGPDESPDKTYPFFLFLARFLF